MSPDAVILVQDEDLVDIATGKLNVQKAIQKKIVRMKGKKNAMVYFTNILLGARPKL